ERDGLLAIAETHFGQAGGGPGDRIVRLQLRHVQKVVERTRTVVLAHAIASSEHPQSRIVWLRAHGPLEQRETALLVSPALVLHGALDRVARRLRKAVRDGLNQ